MLQQINTQSIQSPMDDVEAYADFRLTGWGEWIRSITKPGPKVINHSVIAIVPSGVAEYDDPDADEIERIVAPMMCRDKQRLQYLALCAHYVGYVETKRGKRFTESFREAVAAIQHLNPELHATKSAFEKALAQGRAYVAGALAAKR